MYEISDETRLSILNEMEDVLIYRNFEPSWSALETIFDTFAENKKELIDLLSKHPKWNPEKLMINFDEDFTRQIDRNVIYSFSNWIVDYLIAKVNLYKYGLYFRNPEPGSDAEAEQNRLYQLVWFIRDYVTSQFFSTEIEEAIANINSLNENYHLRTNMKASKAILKIFREEGWDKLGDLMPEGDKEYFYKEFNRRYAEFADALNPLNITRHTCISVNPIDYLLMSNGNSWNSCHNIEDADDCGCYSAGTISYMLDGTSFIFYTVDASYDGDEIEQEPKVTRQVFSYNDEMFLQSRLYPASNDCGCDHLYTETRNIIQKVLAECLDKPNRWVKTRNDLCEIVESGKGACNYPDWSTGPGKYNCNLSILKEREERARKITVGHQPICISCGDYHSNHEHIDCCYRSGYYCEDCGGWVSEDDAIWCGDYTYCRNCVTYCEYCQEYYPNDEVQYLENMGSWGMYVCNECLSDHFVECKECGDYVEYDDAQEDSNGNYYCDKCAKEYLMECSECGGVYHSEDLKYDRITDREYCSDCYDELIEEREREEEEVYEAV